MLERVIEEQARGEATRANEVRAEITATIGDDLAQAEARLGSGEGAEGAADPQKRCGRNISRSASARTPKSSPRRSRCRRSGIWPRPGSIRCRRGTIPSRRWRWSCRARGQIVGATLGNDVNLRDVEGRSALLLGKAKDNNASAALGPFIRLFDADFSLDDVRQAELRLTVEGDDGFKLNGASDMSKISRDPEDIVRQTIGPNHQYPDGFVLYLGTMFAPTEDRGAPGQGFTHKIGDVVSVESPRLGRLTNVMVSTTDAEPWTFGTAALMRNLAKRGLI